MSSQGDVVPAEWLRRVRSDLAASARPEAGEADGPAGWDEWYRQDSDGQTLAEALCESKYDFARRAFLAGWAARDEAQRRGAADELAALSDDGRER